MSDLQRIQYKGLSADYIRSKFDYALAKPTKSIDESVMPSKCVGPHDVSFLFALDINKFVFEVYRTLLGRDPDSDSFYSCQRLLCSGMPKPALVSMIADSEEFGHRFEIVGIEQYKIPLRNFSRKQRIKRIPVLGNMISLILYAARINSREADKMVWEADRRYRAELAAERDKGILEGIESFRAMIDSKSNCIVKCTKDEHNALADKLDDKYEALASELNDKYEALASELGNRIKVFSQEMGFPKEMLCGYARALDEQIITASGLTPTMGLERVQAGIIKRIADKREEFAMYDALPIEVLSRYIDGATAVTGHLGHVLKRYAAENELGDVLDVGMSFADISCNLSQCDTLIVANPALSALIVATPPLLREITAKLKRRLVLAMRVTGQPVSAVWEGFSVVEEKPDAIARWAEGKTKSARIKLYNTVCYPLDVELSWAMNSACGYGEIDVQCNQKRITAELDRSREMRLNLRLLPGHNNIDFLFSGDIVRPEGDVRELSFYISNFQCMIAHERIESKFLYYEEYSAMFSDAYVRLLLHMNGYFEVNAKAYEKHGLTERALPRSNYRYPYGMVMSDETCVQTTNTLVLYDAYRLTQSRTAGYEE